MDDFKDAAKFAALATPIIAILALQGGKLAMSAMIPGMEHMVMSHGMIPDDLASIPGALVDAVGQFIHTGSGIEGVAAVAAPHIDVPVPPEVAPAPAPVEQIEFSDGDGGSGTAHYAYEKPVHGQEGDGFTLVNKDDESNFGQNPFKSEDSGSSAKYEELMKSMHHDGDGSKVEGLGVEETPETGASADTPAVTKPEEHAETIKSDVEKAFTPGTAEEHAKTAEEGVRSAFTPGTSENHAKNIQSGVESHFGNSNPAETAKNVGADVESAFTPGTEEEHAKKIAESVFRDAA